MTTPLLLNLFQFTTIYVERALELARSGHKDEAREWCKFLSNSKLTDLLEFYPPEHPLKIDVARFKRDLEKLSDECHPASHADNSTDFRALKAQVADLDFGLNLLITQNLNKRSKK